MKNRLSRIKTTYNDDGSYDQEMFFNEQKAVYRREIEFATHVAALTEEQFRMQPLEIGFLNSTNLKDEPKLKEVKKIMKEYNKSIIEGRSLPDKGLHMKKVVMDSMLKFMRLMMLAPDTPTKLLILNIAHFWFMKHLDPKATKKSGKQLDKEIKDIIVHKQLLPIDIVNKQLLINSINERLHPYRTKARTIYKQLNDPSIELQNYETHKIQLENIKTQNSENARQAKKWIDTVKFPKIQPLQYAIDEPLPEIKQNEDNPVPPPAQGEPGQEAAKTDGQPAAVEGEQAQQNVGPDVDLDFGAPAEGEPEAEEEDVAEEQKRGKLDPLLKLFILERIRQKEKEEFSCEKVLQKNMNRQNITYEQDFLSREYLREWAKKKSRLRTEINKKTQALKGLQRLPKENYSESEHLIEDEKSRLKMRSTIETYKRGITQVEVPPEKLNTEHGLSLYDRRRIKTELDHKPFSSIMKEHSKRAEEAEVLDQLPNIKQKFAKYKLYTPLDKIVRGLAPPDTEGELKPDQKLLWPNSELISNPFIKVAKKKKKKKKK